MQNGVEPFLFFIIKMNWHKFKATFAYSRLLAIHKKYRDFTNIYVQYNITGKRASWRKYHFLIYILYIYKWWWWYMIYDIYTFQYHFFSIYSKFLINKFLIISKFKNLFLIIIYFYIKRIEKIKFCIKTKIV